jgi:hypothetical protein
MFRDGRHDAATDAVHAALIAAILAGADLKHLPIHFDGSISLREIEEALNSRGIHLRDDGRGRFLAERVPRFLTHAANAVSEQAAAPRAMRLVGRK